MSSPQEQGRLFERDLAAEFGLNKVKGSGNVWHSKLDVKGNKALWNLKYTEKPAFPIKYTEILESLEACYGPGGDGSTPLWAARIPVGDFIVMRKEDFMSLNQNNSNYINEDRPQVAKRKAKAKVPELLRED